MERRTGRMLLRLASALARQVPATLPWGGHVPQRRRAPAARVRRAHRRARHLHHPRSRRFRGPAGLARHALGLDSTERRFPGKATCLAIYSRVVNGSAALGDVLRDAFAWCVPWEEELRGLFAAYVADKQAQHVLDYDDLLLYWAHMAGDAALGAEIGARFDHILVDEYQDTNPLQAAILRGLKPDGRGITVVGDDAQAIYSFRAATGAQHPRLPGSSSRRPPASCG
jgi:DNA helicase-2/ATP-dependent DNA helicase PcrA